MNGRASFLWVVRVARHVHLIGVGLMRSSSRFEVRRASHGERRGSSSNMSCTRGCVRLCAGTKPANEYERTPVPPHARRGWLSFISIFVGRHTAGTEFSIGPLFVARGADPLGILLGLALGNVLAVLSWRFITTPIACRQRLTSFAAFERVVGRRVIVVYDLLAATSLALCCGAMFTVSGTAVGVLLNVDGMPGLEDWTPTSAAFCGAVLASGVVTTCISAFGMRGVSSFSTVTGPFLVAAVLYMGFRSLQLLGVNGIGNLWSVLNEKVWTPPTPPYPMERTSPSRGSTRYCEGSWVYTTRSTCCGRT